ncbi:Tfp pilus assembly protein FimT/FimU [Candidatus Margulisiibacteriota bacterium]
MRKGFTLIEMLVIVLIIGALSGLAYFGFTSIRGSLDVNYSAKQIVLDMRLTQDLAKTLRYPHQIEFPKGSNEYRVIDLEDDRIVKQVRLGSAIRFSGKEIFIFSSSGNPVVGGSGTLVISNSKGRSREVIVSSIGRIRVE